MNYDHSIKLFRRICAVGFFILAGSLFYYQVINGNYYLRRAKNNYVRVIPSRSIRGTIFDRNNQPLAYDRAAFNIAVIPYQIRDNKDFLFYNIARYLKCDTRKLSRNYNRRFQNLFSPIDVILDIDKATAFKIRGYFGEDVIIDPQPQRYYPYGLACSHILGYVKEAAAFYENLKQYGYTPYERVGFSGIEQYYDSYLRGEDGGDLIEVNSKGKIVGFLGNQNAQRGADISLTVDYRIQEIAYRALEGRRGTLILMNSKNGEILSLVSFPAYDPNNFIKGKDVEQYLTGTNKPMHNRAVQSAYPLGSTFKPIVATAALGEEKISPSTTFMCTGEMRLGNTQFRCEKEHGPENLYQGLAHSCNVYFYNLGLLVGRDKICEWAARFGLNTPTNIDLPYEKKGIIPTQNFLSGRQWYRGDTLNLSIGQGYTESSPMEIMCAINVFATGGYLVKPRLLKKIGTSPSEEIRITDIGVAVRTLEIVKKALIDVVNSDDGTARILKPLSLDIAGKTGTAQAKGGSHGWFVGFFPYNAPQYTICIFLENAGSSYEALKVAHTFLEKLKEQKLL
ncbi:MAG: penicillin-binding protein 2 [Candidatus Omnitrophota bacterium]